MFENPVPVDNPDPNKAVDSAASGGGGGGTAWKRETRKPHFKLMPCYFCAGVGQERTPNTGAGYTGRPCWACKGKKYVPMRVEDRVNSSVHSQDNCHPKG